MIKIRPESEIDYLVRIRLPNEHKLAQAESVPSDRRADYESAIEKLAKLRNELSKLPKEQLYTLYGETKQKEREQQELEEDRKFSSNTTGAGVDFEYWGKAKYWTLDEAIALLMGLDPRIAGATAHHYINRSPFAKKFVETGELAKRARLEDPIRNEVDPVQFLQWADQCDFDPPKSLLNAVQRYTNQDLDIKKKYAALEEKYKNLEIDYQKLTRNQENEGVLTQNEYWCRLEKLTIRVIRKYPEWREDNKVVKKTGNLFDWIRKDFKATEREAFIITQVLDSHVGGIR